MKLHACLTCAKGVQFYCLSRTYPVIPYFPIEATDDGLSSLTLQAFEKCDTDDLFGLSWDEIERCEEEFCALLSIPCPTEDEFDSFDENGDGNLTLDEYIIHVQKLIDESIEDSE